MIVENKLTRGSGYFVAGVLMVISLIHIYWALGGTWGFDAAIPTVGGKPEFNPPPVVTALVALALIAAALIILGRMGLWGRGFPQWVFHWGVWGLVMFFILRSTLAFFHTENSLHVYWDVRLFSPLSFVMGLLCWVVAKSKSERDLI